MTSEGAGVKATLREFGGPIDPTGQRARVVDTDSMSKEMADELARLAAEAKAHPPGPDETAGRGRDMMTYSITIEEDGQAAGLEAVGCDTDASLHRRCRIG